MKRMTLLALLGAFAIAIVAGCAPKEEAAAPAAGAEGAAAQGGAVKSDGDKAPN